MVNKPLIPASLAVTLALVLTACASAPSSSTAKSTVTARELPPANCVASTPTGVPAAPQKCVGMGHAWTREDLDRSGAADTAEALRLLDPTVIVTH